LLREHPSADSLERAALQGTSVASNEPSGAMTIELSPNWLHYDDATERHAIKVSRVVEQLRAHDGERPVSFRKKAVSHQVPKRNDARRHDDKIDLGDLDEILRIDLAARTCTAEPGVTFVDLVRATMRFGLVPMVVPELETITIGGAVSGCSLESMSFQYGGFHDSCLEYEILTANGELLRCTPHTNPLVFQMIHGSFGTLGIVTELTFRLVPAKPYVRMQYDTYSNLADYKDAIWRHYRDRDVDFMDGIIHARDRYVLCLGRFADRAPYTNSYDWMKVYYKSTAQRRVDYLKTRDYFFRYDRGVTNVHPKSAIGRLLFGKLLSSSQLLRLAEKIPRVLPAHRPEVTVDLFIPFSKLDEYMQWHEKELGFFPLWCVPYRRVRDYEWISKDVFAGIDDELFVDLAIYGMKQPEGRNVYKEIEDELLRINAIKTLISYNYYDEETFWRIFDKSNYDAVKAITDPKNVFRNLYEKTCRAAQGR
jgi:FAD/FMN-containing dehydrogenase